MARSGERAPGFLAFAFRWEYEFLEQRAAFFLHPQEVSYFHTLQFQSRRESYLLGRCAGKRALASLVPEEPPARIEIARGLFHQPIVQCLAAAVPELSLAHSKNIAVAVATASGHIAAVDVELLEADKLSALSSCASATERALLDKVDCSTTEGLFLLFTMKEALSKALRCGLTAPFSVFEVARLETVGERAFVAHFSNFAQYKALSWIVAGHALSLVVPARSAVGFTPNTELERDLRRAAGVG